MAIHFNIVRNGRSYSANADQEKPFFIGFQTSYRDKASNADFVGLYNVPTKQLPKLIYQADDVRNEFGFWSDFIEPTSRCEGGNYLTLNTYDRARFTWGFGQFGAHVADGDFIKFFRDLLGRPEKSDYFPDLAIVQNRICKIEPARQIPLENAQTTAPLLDYLNPTTTAIEDAEVIAAAKLIHWTANFADARSLQVAHMVEAFKGLLHHADIQLHLDGKTADLCLVICDILHQGRAKYPVMQAALKSASPLTSLLKLGSISYPDRIKTLTSEVKTRAALLSGRTWSTARGDFVEA